MRMSGKKEERRRARVEMTGQSWWKTFFKGKETESRIGVEGGDGVAGTEEGAETGGVAEEEQLGADLGLRTVVTEDEVGVTEDEGGVTGAEGGVTEDEAEVTEGEDHLTGDEVVGNAEVGAGQEAAVGLMEEEAPQIIAICIRRGPPRGSSNCLKSTFLSRRPRN